MYNEQLEDLIDAALADGVLTEKEKQILFKKAQTMGVDLDEFEMVLDARLVKLQKAEQEKAASSAPKSNKFGDVKKCPACGAMVQSYQGVCPECGYAFEGIEAASAVKELSGLLQKASNYGQMEKIIDNFPVPMEKSSLLAFLTWLRPQSIDSKNPLANSYFKKYAECVSKIKVSFADDKQLQPFISSFEADEKKIKNQKIVKYTIKNKWFWVGAAVLVVLFFILKPAPIHRDADKSIMAIEKALKQGNTQEAIDIFMSLKTERFKLWRNGAAESIVDACLAEDNFKDAQRIANYGGSLKYDSYSDYEARITSKLYEYCISHGDFQNAKDIYNTADEPYRFHGQYIKDVVTYMCEHGQKEEAQKFLNSHKGDVDKNGRDLYGNPKEVVKMIQGIINSY